MLADVSENFRNMCLEIYELDPALFLTISGLAWQATLKKSKIRSFNWYRYVINGSGSNRGGICHAIHRFTKANNKYMKDYDKNKELSYLK